MLSQHIRELYSFFFPVEHEVRKYACSQSTMVKQAPRAKHTCIQQFCCMWFDHLSHSRSCDSSQDTKLNTRAPPETNSTTNTLEHWSFKNAVVSLNFASTEATFRDSTALDSPGISKALYCP